MDEKFLIYIFSILSIPIKKDPLLNFTSTVSKDFIDKISPISSIATKSGGLNIGILSEVFRYETGAINFTLSRISNFIDNSHAFMINISIKLNKISTNGFVSF